MAYYNTQALVLASQNYGEADRILTLLTYERGRVRAMVRGARRPRNRFAALAQPLNLIEVQLSGNGGLENLAQGQLVNNYRHLKADLDRMAYGSYIVELFDRATEGASDVAEMFIFLLNVLELVQFGNDLEMTKLLTEIVLLSGMGFRPNLEHCTICQETVDEKKPLHYNIREGGIVCSSHAVTQQQLLCSWPTVLLLRELLRVDPRNLDSLHASAEMRLQASHILQFSLQEVLGSMPRSADFLATVVDASVPEDE